MFSTNPTFEINARRADMLRDAHKRRLIRQATQRRVPSLRHGLRILAALLIIRPQ